ncbi:MAG: hypothetical protein KAT04_15195 [Methylococcales bacterium]|nr:hypothetical protein [Methylococcales bacterium]
MSNLLIVESHNDKYFFEALIAHINVPIEIDSPIYAIDEYECLYGINQLEKKLTALKSQVAKEGIDKIGVILDADNVGIKARKQEIRDTIKLVFGDNPDTAFSIYILNVDGKGELETLLKAIKSAESPMADCLDAWQQCLTSKDETLTQKDFDKFWIQIYHRYDCCSNQEKRQAGCKCNFEASLKKKIYNFDKEELNDLKHFLKNLSS